MPGPPPNPHARRGSPNPVGALVLPASGYKGDVPEWPLSMATGPELRAWIWFWRTPQAAAWAQQRLSRTVARYIRALIPAEEVGAIPFLLAEVRQLEDRLGLTPMSMLRLHWMVSYDEVEARREVARPRLSAVDLSAVDEEDAG